MKTAYKILRHVACILLAIGTVLVIIGGAMGASWRDVTVDLVPEEYRYGWHYGRNRYNNTRGKSIELKETYTGVKSFQFDIEDGEVFIETGDTFSVEVRGRGKSFTSKAEGGIWYIDSRGLKDGKNYYTLNITLPKGFVAEDAIINMGMGNFNAETLAAKRTSINTGMGSVDIDGFSSAETELACGMGSVELGVDGSELDYGFSATVGMGEITIGENTKIAGIAGEQTSGNERPNQMKIDCGMGSVEIDFNR